MVSVLALLSHTQTWLTTASISVLCIRGPSLYCSHIYHCLVKLAWVQVVMPAYCL